jgi:DNA-binding response OmpR family regulator
MNAKKILIADDEARMRKLMGDFLKKAGFEIIEAEDGKKALAIFSEVPGIDLLILDVMMPGYDGWTVCREVRKISNLPIIMLTARGEESDQLFGFELGADEYVVKPFSPSVLVARVQALLKRAQNSNNIRAKITYDGLEIDQGRHSVMVEGESVNLTPKEYELLLFMVQNEGIALSRDKILNTVWDFDYFGDTRTVDTHIKKLRMKLSQKGEYIQTVRGLGYRFEVTEV